MLDYKQFQNISKVVSLGRRNATVSAEYSVDQKAEEESGRLEQHVIGKIYSKITYFNIFHVRNSSTVVIEWFSKLLFFYIACQPETNCLSVTSDFEKLSTETVGEHFKDKDVFFCTLGTTRRAAGSAVSILGYGLISSG